MIGGTVTHLRPGVSSVTIGAKQPQVASVRLPIAQPVVPSAGPALLQCAVDVVNVEHAEVAFAAVNAGTAKLSDERQLPSPVSRMLVTLVGVDSPILVAATVVAKSMLARLPALFARFRALPPSGQIAIAPAILSGAITQPVEVGFKRLTAVAAGDFNSALFHYRNIARNCVRTKYFDIACRRIEDAQRQSDLFIGAAA